jgi:hypothetical protein
MHEDIVTYLLIDSSSGETRSARLQPPKAEHRSVLSGDAFENNALKSWLEISYSSSPELLIK